MDNVELEVTKKLITNILRTGIKLEGESKEVCFSSITESDLIVLKSKGKISNRIGFYAMGRFYNVQFGTNQFKVWYSHSLPNNLSDAFKESVWKEVFERFPEIQEKMELEILEKRRLHDENQRLWSEFISLRELIFIEKKQLYVRVTRQESLPKKIQEEYIQESLLDALAKFPQFEHIYR